MFTSDDHYNLRTRARPVDYSLTRRSFEIALEDEYPSFGGIDISPTKHDHSVTSSDNIQETRRTNFSQSEVSKPNSDSLEGGSSLGSEFRSGHGWPEDSHVSSSLVKHESERGPIKAPDSLHPAFHKHLFSQVHHHGKSSSDSFEYTRQEPPMQERIWRATMTPIRSHKIRETLKKQLREVTTKPDQEAVRIQAWTSR